MCVVQLREKGTAVVRIFQPSSSDHFGLECAPLRKPQQPYTVTGVKISIIPNVWQYVIACMYVFIFNPHAVGDVPQIIQTNAVNTLPSRSELRHYPVDFVFRWTSESTFMHGETIAACQHTRECLLVLYSSSVMLGVVPPKGLEDNHSLFEIA